MRGVNSATFHLGCICRNVLELQPRPSRLAAGFRANPVRIKNTSTSLNSDQLRFEAGINYDTFLARPEVSESSWNFTGNHRK